MSKHESKREAQVLRRRKRQAKTNGDRQYFQAVKKLKRDKIDKWQVEHKPDRLKARLVQKSLQAMRRQRKQMLRSIEVGDRVKIAGVRKLGYVLSVDSKREFPLEVEFRSKDGENTIELYTVEAVAEVRKAKA